mgnify:CR=1 FL=1
MTNANQIYCILYPVHRERSIINGHRVETLIERVINHCREVYVVTAYLDGVKQYEEYDVKTFLMWHEWACLEAEARWKKQPRNWFGRVADWLWLKGVFG